MKKLISLFIMILATQSYSQDLGEWIFVDELMGFTRNMGCHDSTDCWIINQSDGDQSHYMYKSSDQGRSWQQTYHLNAWNTTYPLLLQSNYAFSPHPDHYYIGFDNIDSTVLKSTDGGYTFNRTSIGVYQYIRLFMQNKDNGIFLLDSLVDIEEPPYQKNIRKVAVTKNGWKSFNTKDFPEPHSNRFIRFVDTLSDGTMRFKEQDLWISHYNIERDEWKEIGRSGYNIFSIDFVNDSVGYIANSGGTGIGHTSFDRILKTTDGGKTFNLQIDTLVKSNPMGVKDISFHDENNGIAVGARGKVWMTNNGGDNWHCWDCDGEDIPEVFMRNEDDVYGPPLMFVMWAGRNPIISTRLGGNMYRYEGDFFKFKDPLAGPELIFPEDSSTKQDHKITFKWNIAEDAVHYLFQISETPDMLNIIHEKKTGGNQLIYDDLKQFRDYYWRVQFINENEKAWSEIFTFRTKLLPVNNLKPDCNITYFGNNIEFEWAQHDYCGLYKFQLAKDIDFNNVVIEEDSIKINNAFATNLEDSTTYYWRTKGYNEEEETEWTEPCRLRIEISTSVREDFRKFSISPNPVHDELRIENYEIGLNQDIKIYNVLGEKVLNASTSGNSVATSAGGGQIRLDVSHLPAGVYFIKIGDRVEKFIKE